MSRHAFVRLTLLILLHPLLLAPASAGAVTADRGILWRVEATDGATSHILGTIHSDDERVIDLPAPVERTFTDSRRYLFEVDFRRALEGGGMMQMFYLDGRSLADDLDDALWQRAVDAAAGRGIPQQSLRMMKPWALATVLSTPEVEPTGILDYQLYARARRRDAPVDGLETVDEQLGLFDEMPREQQIRFLRQTLEQYHAEGIETLHGQLVELYLDRDLAGMLAMADDHPALPARDENAALMRRVVDQRNRIMVTRMKPALREGGAFVAIGALHLPGEEGILELLEREGFAVSVVY